MMSRKYLPFVAQAPWYLKVWIIIGISILGYALWMSPSPIHELWQIWTQRNLLGRLFIMLTAVGLPIGVAGILLEKTIFRETGIEYRSKFLMTMFKSYSDIEILEYDAGNLGRPKALKIIYSDLSKLTITANKADLNTITQIINSHSDKTVPINYVRCY